MSKPGLRVLTLKLMRTEDVNDLEEIKGPNTSESVRQAIRHYAKYLRSLKTRRNGKKAA